MPKVTLLQLATPQIDNYAKYSIASASEYAKRHGYDLFVQRSQIIQDLHINWTKIAAIRDVLSMSEMAHNSFVVLLDADTAILDYNKDISYFLDRYGNPLISIFMAADTPFTFSTNKRPNAGFIIVRNDATGRAIIDRWIDAAYTDGAKYNNVHPRNQLVYWNCVEPEYAPRQQVLPKRYFHKPIWWVPQPFPSRRFLYHITSTDGAKRAGQLENYYFKGGGSEETLRQVSIQLQEKTDGLIQVQ